MNFIHYMTENEKIYIMNEVAKSIALNRLKKTIYPAGDFAMRKKCIQERNRCGCADTRNFSSYRFWQPYPGFL